jgi:urate oxidase/2-oxo-4-hydroxy-4-carboxy-5-ureidoimidazoline decarboxylase
VRIHYGKAAVRFYRTDAHRRLFAGEVALDVSGERLRPAWTQGDNTPIVATDSMKNFIHAAALEYPHSDLEGFAAFVGTRFLEAYPHIDRARIDARELPFAVEGPISYSPRGGDYGAVELDLDAHGIVAHRCARRSLRLLKTTGSSFAGFVRDRYTTLPEARDRPLFIFLDARWRHRTYDERVPTADVRALITETFDAFASESIQHLLHEIGRRVLDRCPAVTEVSLEAQNRLWDVAATSPEDGSRTVYTDPRPPYGVIGLHLAR